MAGSSQFMSSLFLSVVDSVFKIFIIHYKNYKKDFGLEDNILSKFDFVIIISFQQSTRVKLSFQ